MARQTKKRAAGIVDFKSIDLIEDLKFENIMGEEHSEKGDFFGVTLSGKPESKEGVLMSKVLYEGYSEKYDEWIPVTDVIGKVRVEPSDFPPVAVYDLHRIKILIKENLHLNCRMDTLAYIENSISIPTWSTLLPYLQIVKKFPNVQQFLL